MSLENLVGYIIVAIAVATVIMATLWVLLNSKPSALALAIKLAIPVALVALGTIAVIAGRGNYGFPALGVGVIWWLWVLPRASKKP